MEEGVVSARRPIPRDARDPLPLLWERVVGRADRAFARPSRRFLGPHIFDRVCIENGIEHRLTEPYHPWTNGWAERMNRTIEDATVKVYHYDDLKRLRAHVPAFVTALQLRQIPPGPAMANAMSGICETRTKGPSIFKINPHHLIPDHTPSPSLQSGRGTASCKTKGRHAAALCCPGDVKLTSR